MNEDRSKFSCSARLKSFRYAFCGLKSLLCSQHNAWIHAVATLFVTGLGLYCGLTRENWCFIVLVIMAVWTAEALNTALEFLADVASPEFHPLVEKAKDVAAAAVLIASVGALIVGGLVFTPYL